MSTVNRKTPDKRFKFSEGEKVLCFQGPLVYEAKCLKLEASEDETASYFVHYNGWNKHWDEWVPESRVMKYNETNLQKQKDLLKQFGKEKSRGSSDGRERPKRSKSVKEKTKVEKEPENKPEVRRTSVDLSVTSNPTNQEPKRKKARVESVEEKEEVEIVHEMFDTSLNIPHELGVMLADDWDLINHQKQLYDLPAKVTVEDILNKYLESRNNLSIVTQQSSIQLKEMVLGLSEYFSVMLGSQLLYKFERPQFGDILDKYPGRTASQIYGCPHFLRFFVRVRSTVASQSLLNDNSLVILITSIRDCLEFLKDEAASWFNINDYVIAPAEYHRRAMT